MELREIELEDVFPDEKNPRKDFGDIAALAESCMLNAINPGEPVNPIVVVEDGGIYRIVDGERRYKAMAKNKLKRCHAVVCEDLDEANSMVAMVATDDKQQLSEIERSRGVQQMLLLGVDPERIERVGRLGKGGAAKLRRARQAVDDAGDDMTLDRMLAIAEFEEAGDEEAVERLTNCVEAAWRGVADDIRATKKKLEKRKALLRACEEAGVELSEKRLMSVSGWSWAKDVREPDELASKAAEMPEGFAACMFENSLGPMIELYKPVADTEDPTDPEQVERLRRVEEAKETIDASKASRLAWFHARISDLDSMPSVMDIVEDSALGGYEGIGNKVDEYEEKSGFEIDRAFCPILAAFGWQKATRDNELRKQYVEYLVKGDIPSYYTDSIERFVGWLAAFEADGYQMTEAELELKGLCEAALADDEEEEEQA